MLEHKKILITGPASQVAYPLARELAAKNQVFGLARFGTQADRDRVDALGVTTIQADLASGDFEALPRDFDYVLHFAVVKTGDFDYDLAANVEGTGLLMSHCRDAKAFLHCSSGAVYQYPAPKPGHPLEESDPLGDNHRGMMPTYSICKIASEAMARFCARQWNLPTTIARFSVPYGDNGGWPWYHLLMMKNGAPIPLHPDGPNAFNPIHEDDYIRQIPRLLEIATVPATIINWGGDEVVSIEEWCAYLGELTGLKPSFTASDQSIPSLVLDAALSREKLGATRVSWRDAS
jgi:UDP-glucuronate 4-epimerase